MDKNPQPIAPSKKSEVIQGYNNFVSTLKLVRKHRPFAEVDNLPKICQPEDHIEVNSPRDSSSDQSGSQSSGSQFTGQMEIDTFVSGKA